MEQARLIDLTTFIAGAFRGDACHRQAERFFEDIDEGKIMGFTLHICAIEAEMLYLSMKVRVAFNEWMDFIKSILENPKIEKVPLSSSIFAEHLKLYKGFGGKFTYFDSFHAATARVLGVRLITYDETLLGDPNTPTDDLKKYLDP